MSLALDAESVPAEETERPFSLPDAQAEAALRDDLAKDALNYVRGKLQGTAASSHLLRVLAVDEVDGELGVALEADRNTFDAVRKAGLQPASYSYRRGREHFTVQITVEELAGMVSASIDAASKVEGDDEGETTG